MYQVEMHLRLRRACMVEGMSVREASRVFGLHRDTVRKMLEYSVPPGYRRESPPRVLLSSDSVSLNGKRLCQSERLMAG